MELIDVAAMAIFAGGAVALILVLGGIQKPTRNESPRLLMVAAIGGVIVIGGVGVIAGLQVSLVMAATLSLGSAGLIALTFVRATPEERDRQRMLAGIMMVAAVSTGCLAIAALALGAGSPD